MKNEKKEQSKTPAGAPIKSCEDDSFCVSLSCEVCMIEIPPDALKSHEGEAYALRHCGAECVEKMREAHAKQEEPRGEGDV